MKLNWMVILSVLGTGIVVLLGKTVFLRTVGYCTQLNRCPSDKCDLVSECAMGGDGMQLGCVLGPSRCEFKDRKLKWMYQEVSRDEAVKCIADFAVKNDLTYPMLKYLEVKKDEGAKDVTSNCSQPIGGRIEFDKRDNFCWRFEMNHANADYKRFPFGVGVYVGAQTCSVYLDPRGAEVLKINDPSLSLADINFTVEQAVVCAERYVAEHKGEYEEYRNYKLGSLKTSFGAVAGSHAAVKDISDDWNFYTLSGGGVYLVVGARTCGVYGVNEKYYKRL